MTTKKGHVPVYDFVEWPDSPVDMMKEYAIGEHRGFGAHPVPGSGDPETKMANKKWMPTEFVLHSQDIVRNLGYEAKRWRYWVSIISEETNKHEEEVWAQGFPHTHGWEGLTMIHYLQVPSGGGDLVIRDWQRDEIERFTPQVGWTAVIDGRTEHGVERVWGEVPRITLISTAYLT
jgi:hypothetical protein